jgi:hypothetical protein
LQQTVLGGKDDVSDGDLDRIDIRWRAGREKLHSDGHLQVKQVVSFVLVGDICQHSRKPDEKLRTRDEGEGLLCYDHTEQLYRPYNEVSCGHNSPDPLLGISRPSSQATLERKSAQALWLDIVFASHDDKDGLLEGLKGQDKTQEIFLYVSHQRNS